MGVQSRFSAHLRNVQSVDQSWIKHANAEELLRRAQQHGLAVAILDELDRERQELRCSVAETQSCLVGKAS